MLFRSPYSVAHRLARSVGRATDAKEGAHESSADTDDGTAPPDKVALFHSELAAIQPMDESGSGWILTNRHVVTDANKLIVELKDGRKFDGTVYASHPIGVRVEPTGVVIERIRETVAPDGTRHAEGDEIHLDAAGWRGRPCRASAAPSRARRARSARCACR